MNSVTALVLVLLGIFMPTLNGFSHLPSSVLFVTRKQNEDAPSTPQKLFQNTKRPPTTALSASSVTPVFSNVTSAAVSPISSELLVRSSFCALSTMTTWAMVQRLGMTIVQASASQGLLGCLVLPKPYALAFLCGSFAGMSAHPGAVAGEAGLLGILCSSIFYIFEDKKLAVGKGGRLGLIAFLSNIVYYTIRKGPRALSSVLTDTVLQIGGPESAAGIVLAGSLLLSVRNNAKSSPIKTRPLLKQKITLLATQSIVLALLLKRLVTQGVPIISMAATLATTFVSSLLVWKSPYTATTVAGLGVLSGFFLPSISPAVYMGTFIGMCSLPGFRMTQFLLASTVSASLLQLGILGGFGGRLGFLAYLGVSFGL